MVSKIEGFKQHIGQHLIQPVFAKAQRKSIKNVGMGVGG
jgi:hypothetical protein